MYLQGDIPGLGETVSIQVQTLDSVGAKELGKLEVKFIDNLHDMVCDESMLKCGHVADEYVIAAEGARVHEASVIHR